LNIDLPSVCVADGHGKSISSVIRCGYFFQPQYYAHQTLHLVFFGSPPAYYSLLDMLR
jgi:hypothetical protein